MRILLVEDDSSLARGLAAALAAEGHVIDTVESGEHALVAAGAESFDIIILDIGLPGMDGFEVLRRLRERSRSQAVLVLTARDAIDDRVRGLDLGADDYLVKPFALPELAARVRMLARRGQAARGSRIVHGPLVFDQEARRAFLSDRPLDLSAREWMVLEILLVRAEKVVTKDAIIRALTGWDEDLSANAVEVYVSRLRSKLDPAGIRISTVRGFGYMLEQYRAA